MARTGQCEDNGMPVHATNFVLGLSILTVRTLSQHCPVLVHVLSYNFSARQCWDKGWTNRVKCGDNGEVDM